MHILFYPAFLFKYYFRVKPHIIYGWSSSVITMKSIFP
jgi:hypothetical protein